MIVRDKVFNKIEVMANGVIFVQELNRIVEDGVVIQSVPHRTPLCPGEDASAFADYPMVMDAIETYWTEQVIADYQEAVRNRVL